MGEKHAERKKKQQMKQHRSRMRAKTGKMQTAREGVISGARMTRKRFKKLGFQRPKERAEISVLYGGKHAEHKKQQLKQHRSRMRAKIQGKIQTAREGIE